MRHSLASHLDWTSDMFPPHQLPQYELTPEVYYIEDPIEQRWPFQHPRCSHQYPWIRFKITIIVNNFVIVTGLGLCIAIVEIVLFQMDAPKGVWTYSQLGKSTAKKSNIEFRLLVLALLPLFQRGLWKLWFGGLWLLGLELLRSPITNGKINVCSLTHMFSDRLWGKWDSIPRNFEAIAKHRQIYAAR